MYPDKKKLCIIEASFFLPGIDPERSLFHQLIDKKPGDIEKAVKSIPFPRSLSRKEVRRMSKLTRLAVAASEKISVSSLGDEINTGLCIGLTHGSTILFLKFLDYLFDYGPEMASPNAFSNGVTNATLGAVSRQADINSEGLTLMGSENCGILVLEHAWEQIVSGTYDLCLAGASEEYLDKKEEVYRKTGWFCGGKTPAYLPFINTGNGKESLSLPVSEGSVFFLVTTPDIVRRISPGEHFTVEFVEKPYEKNIGDIDLIVSGAAGGPQDKYELEMIKTIVKKSGLSCGLFFPKQYTGEIFAVSPMAAIITAMDIISSDDDSPVAGKNHPDLKNCADINVRASDVNSALVLSCSRSGEISAAIIRKEPSV